MKWFVQARRNWLELLRKQDTSVGERPNPAAVEILGNIDLLQRTEPPVRFVEFLRKWRFFFPILATLALAYVMFSPCNHNSVWLSVKAAAVSFTVDRAGGGPVLRELSLRKLTANPVDVFRTCGEKSGSLAFSSLDHTGGTATVLPTTRMRLNTFSLPAGAKIAVFADRQQGVKLALAYPMSTVTISGTAEGVPAKGGCDFQFRTTGTALELALMPEDPELSDPVYGQIPINAVEFNFPNFELGRSLSSIISGILSFSDLADTKYTLDRGSRLSMDLRRGTLADLRVAHQELSLLLQGDASRVRIGYQEQRDITPAKLDWLRSKQRNIELWLGLMYFTAILYGVDVARLRKG
jgi:hypothetical protein